MAEPIETYSLSLDALLKSGDCRFDAGHYSPDYFEVISLLEDAGMRLEPLGNLVERVILPNRFKRIYVEQEDGVPFLQGSHIVHFQAADVKYLSPATLPNMKEITVRGGWVLVTRSGTVGRVALCPQEWDRWAASEHIIRVVPDEKKCLAGFLCAFLSSRLGQVQMSANIHGAVVDELTAEQVESVLVPIPERKADVKLVRSIDAGMKRSTALKSQAVVAAQSSVWNVAAWLAPSAPRRAKDIRIPDTTPEQLAQRILAGGAAPRPETKKRKAS